MRRLVTRRRLAALAVSSAMIVAPIGLATPASAHAGNVITVSGSATAAVAPIGGGGSFVFTATACATVGELPHRSTPPQPKDR